ncbi:LOW QUALITY PROTEIN: hypothetical protein V2J09_018606 [Rumex salicifolius]
MKGDDKYRSILNDKEEAKSTAWRHGAPPTYDDNLEMVMKCNDSLAFYFKSVNPDNALLMSSLPDNSRRPRRRALSPPTKPSDQPSLEEIISVFSGPPAPGLL